MKRDGIMRNINAIGALGLGAIVTGAYIFQFVLHELPCPLCLLQRIGMLGAAFGLLLNVRFGLRPPHYALAILSALFGAAASARQILLHIVPVAGRPPGFGTPLFGLHMYTWALLIFLFTIITIACLMLYNRQFRDSRVLPLTGFQQFVFWFIIVLAAANVLTTLLQCGIMPCPDNPVEYRFL
jgi:disulfide bond formation protein DsbB